MGSECSSESEAWRALKREKKRQAKRREKDESGKMCGNRTWQGRGKEWMGTSIQKQYIELCGNPLSVTVLWKHLKSQKLLMNVIMGPERRQDYVTEEIVNKYHFGKVRASSRFGLVKNAMTLSGMD